ncbi:chemotaxis protein CheW [Anaeromyxobacter diazotrophicus]|uniref:Chemotaxis protein CheW n=1 Tax=Anaeromyxobacter diazotrophicus TaxID=2590199 RepID=A0A7I9VL25_9BACT|nr:chemotaxis protein CheW [Anaeromyxobacter diazotrophicus]GEJ57101.1 chemotaxis protein CheW [Anaeromyxobacter diazotrophicus]
MSRALHVLFRVGAAEYALPAAEVLQMESYAGATPVPGAPAFVAGVVQVRGRVLPVLDLRARFGLAPAEPSLDRRLVVAQHRERPVALLVDSAREVLTLEADDFRPPPPMVSEEAEGLVKAVAQVGPRLVLMLDFPKLIGEEALDAAQQA